MQSSIVKSLVQHAGSSPQKKAMGIMIRQRKQEKALGSKVLPISARVTGRNKDH